MKTNNHPANGPVSLDRLHQIREILRKAAAQSDGGNLGYAMADAVKVIDGAIAAMNANPVAEIKISRAGYDKGEKIIDYFSEEIQHLTEGQKLYAAPPAPVVQDERAAFNAWNNDENLPIAGVGAKNAAWLAWQARAVLCGNSVLKVPPERPADSSSCDDVEAWFDEGWNACRAAMLQAGNSPVTPDGWVLLPKKLTAPPATVVQPVMFIDGDISASDAEKLAAVIREWDDAPAPERDQVRREHAAWSDETFGDVGPVGPLKHLSKEAIEAAAEPGDLSEWADMQFLLWDAQRRAGISDDQITQAMLEKLAVNKQREWPEPKDGEPCLHIKEKSELMLPEIECDICGHLSTDPEGWHYCCEDNSND